MFNKQLSMLTIIGALATATSLQAKADGQTNPAAPAQPQVAITTVVQNDEGEKLVADSFGKTLYVFDVDQGAVTPKCVGDCAEIWPPYLLNADDDVANLKSPLGAIQRANKKMQLTYNGHPVYTYIFDRTQGDDKGDGLGGVWHYIEIK